jgi:hypothetical protein
MARITTLGIVGRFAIVLIATVIVQGILSLKLRVFGYFDLPLICSVYYGFVLGNPIASIVGSSSASCRIVFQGLFWAATGSAKPLSAFWRRQPLQSSMWIRRLRVFALFLFSIGDGLLVSILDSWLIKGSASNSGDIGKWLHQQRSTRCLA